MYQLLIEQKIKQILTENNALHLPLNEQISIVNKKIWEIVKYRDIVLTTPFHWSTAHLFNESELPRRSYLREQYLIPYKENEVYVRYSHTSINEGSILKFNKSQKFKDFEKQFRKDMHLYHTHSIITLLEVDGVPGYIKIIVDEGTAALDKWEFRLISNMRMNGYFMSKDRATQYKDHPQFGDILVYQFEPYYYKGKKLTIKDSLFHVTDKKNEVSILKNGLIAGCKNKIFKYPNRIYCYLKIVPENIFTLFYQGNIFEYTNRGKNEISIFSLNIPKLIENNIEFYYDPMYLDDVAVYTYEEFLPVSYITKTENYFI